MSLFARDVTKADGVHDFGKFTRRAGPFLLGQKVNLQRADCLTHVLARKDGTDEYYSIKILTRKKKLESELGSEDLIKGKRILRNEFNLLSLLEGVPGIVRQHGMFEDSAAKDIIVDEKICPTGKIRRRVCLVLDCHQPHQFTANGSKLISLDTVKAGLPELEALQIFQKIMTIVVEMHKMNVVHGDLSLDNIVVHRDTKCVTISGFGQGAHLAHDGALLPSYTGFPPYNAPEITDQQPHYAGKPADIWSLGVLFYGLLKGTLPYTALWKHHVEERISYNPINKLPVHLSNDTTNLIALMLARTPELRPKAVSILLLLNTMLACAVSLVHINDRKYQNVPDVEKDKLKRAREAASKLVENHRRREEFMADIDRFLLLPKNVDIVTIEDMILELGRESTNSGLITNDETAVQLFDGPPR